MAHPKGSLKHKIHEIIFEADTPYGKLFDVALLIFIVLSVLVVMLETVPGVGQKYLTFFKYIEWFFTIVFSIEYGLRLYSVIKPMKYATSFFGIIDLLAIIPTFLELLFVGSHSLVVIRALRLLRVFRIFKLTSFLHQSKVIMLALRSSFMKISIFMFFILIMVTIFGSVMYVIETDVNPDFDSIPRSVYWSIVTLTTVGYGDIYPITALGQTLSSILMIVAYGVIAVPTGIVTSAMINRNKATSTNTQACENCSAEGHDDDALYCKNCGDILNPE